MLALTRISYELTFSKLFVIYAFRYLKYIKYLKEVGCWRHPAYILKKREALADKANRTEDMVWAGNKHVRELIPDCVVEMVRKMYPNPVGKGYDGEAPFFKIQDKNKPS